MPTKPHLEQEKKVRREIANSNERRRMQSINAGFQSLKNLIPHQEGEKLSKVGCSSIHVHIFFKSNWSSTILNAWQCQWLG